MNHAEISDQAELSREDLAYLDWARKIARRGWGRVHPNPLVGCVLVLNNQVVGEGYHREFGGAHAEIIALEAAKSKAEGATAYVSLEPCNHEGKTPPCSQALVQAGVVRVIYGVAEPGVKEGGGRNTLARGGIEVIGPVWDSIAGRIENPSFFHVQTHGTPYIALKLALSLDGYIGIRGGVRTQVTGLDAEREVHRLRTGFDAILIGTETLRVDNPRLTVRMARHGRRPVRRLVLDARAELPSDAAIFDDLELNPLHIFTHQDASESEIARLESLGAHVHSVPKNNLGLDLESVMGVVQELGIQSVLCEGGAKLANSLIRKDLVQRLYLFVAPKTLGPGGILAFGDSGESLKWDNFLPTLAPELHGRDTLIVLDRKSD
tara:strand:+ start:12334 stop:13467 length:1134 start_codon:yes stop_codon:yes gene_type:complete